eukprot:1867798-Pyramimonas_sp.AAC.1
MLEWVNRRIVPYQDGCPELNTDSVSAHTSVDVMDVTPVWTLHQCGRYINVDVTPVWTLHQCGRYTSVDVTSMCARRASLRLGTLN